MVTARVAFDRLNKTRERDEQAWYWETHRPVEAQTRGEAAQGQPQNFRQATGWQLVGLMAHSRKRINGGSSRS
jgi:hypothetical protein